MEIQKNKVETREIEVNGTTLQYLYSVEQPDSGTERSRSKPPLLLLHGLLGGSFCWRMNIAALSQQRTVMALDLPGFGEYDAPHQTDCSMQTQADRLVCMLEKLSLDRVDVIGSSWGGAVALFLAARSNKVRSMVLAAPVNPWSDLGSGRVRLLSGRLGGMFLHLALPISRPVHLTAVQRMYGDPKRIPPGTVDGYSSRLLRPGRVHNILNTLRSWEQDITALRAEIPRVKARSLLVWGTRDGAVDVRSAEKLKQVLPDCELALIQGAGHLTFEEMPEEFNRLALDFLAQT
jgi:4,5:9,10-diseco-3-hydroxy-5,9,17-trioxoandrosta-1(10),2-diene-4-oate hydrolase